MGETQLVATPFFSVIFDQKGGGEEPGSLCLIFHPIFSQLLARAGSQGMTMPDMVPTPQLPPSPTGSYFSVSSFWVSSGTCVRHPQSDSTCTEHCECQLCLSATNNPPGYWPSCLSRTNERNSGRLFWKHVGLFAHLFECQLGQAHRGCWRFPVPTSLPCYPFSQGVPAAPEQRGGEAGGWLPRTMPCL